MKWTEDYVEFARFETLGACKEFVEAWHNRWPYNVRFRQRQLKTYGRLAMMRLGVRGATMLKMDALLKDMENHYEMPKQR